LFVFFCRFDADVVLVILSARPVPFPLAARRFSDESCRLYRRLRSYSIDELVCNTFEIVHGDMDELQTHAKEIIHAKRKRINF
jgi:hypothetical protein